MNENKCHNALNETKYKSGNFIILKRKKIKDIEFKNNNISKNCFYKNKKFLNNAIFYYILFLLFELKFYLYIYSNNSHLKKYEIIELKN